MTFINNPGRFTGLLYVAASAIGIFGLLYVPSKLLVHGDAAATANNIASHELLFRLGTEADLIGQAIFILVALALYNLFKPVNPRHALAMLVLILVAIPIAMLNELNSFAALELVRAPDPVSLLGEKPQREAMATLFLNLRGSGFDIAGIFWGLWLFPLGLLVYRSGFVPRFLGVLLMIGCFAYLTNSFTSIVLPQYSTVVDKWASPLQAVEMLFMAWLLIIGAKPSAAVSGGADASSAQGPARTNQ